LIKNDKNENKSSDEHDKYVVYYHGGLKNRGNGIRLLFEEANVPYTFSQDVGSVSLCFGKTTKTDVFAPPILQYNDSYLSQTSAIIQFVATKLNLRPKSDFDNARADMLVGNCFDLAKELSDHASDNKEALLAFLNGRFQVWLDTIEKPLSHASKQEHVYYFDNHITHGDLAIFNTLDALEEGLTEKHFKTFVTDKHPLLHRHYQQIGTRPNIKKFIDDQKKNNIRWYPPSYKTDKIPKTLESQ